MWYATEQRRRGDWRHQRDRRLRVADAAVLEGFPDPEGAAYIRTVAERLMQDRDPPTLLLPCLVTENGKRLILDGNHRAVATFIAGREPRLLLVGVHAPPDPLLLPDLLHERSAGMTPDEWETRRAAVDRHFREELHAG